MDFILRVDTINKGIINGENSIVTHTEDMAQLRHAEG